MKIVTVPAKYSQVADFFRKKIRSGQLAPGERIATVRDLAEQFDVSLEVIVSAFNVLEKEGLLFRKPRSGTFVANWKLTKLKTVALIMKTSGHLYEKQKNKIITDFQRHGFMTLVIDLGKFIESNMKDQDAMLDELIERQVDILVVDGDSAFPFPLLESKLDKLPLLAFINRYECVNYIDSIRVLPDFEKGSYLATKHLFDIGRKKILFHINDPVHIKDKACYSRTIHAGMMAGYCRAVREVGIEEQVFFSRSDADFNVVRDILASSNRPDGIVASSDFSAKSIFDVCVELGLDIPGDLAVVGFFNTPWADFVSPQISSISIREDLMASTLTSELISTYSTKGKVSKEIIIPPELIIRESSVKRNDKNAEKLAAIHKGKILTKKLA